MGCSLQRKRRYVQHVACCTQSAWYCPTKCVQRRERLGYIVTFDKVDVTNHDSGRSSQSWREF